MTLNLNDGDHFQRKHELSVPETMRRRPSSPRDRIHRFLVAALFVLGFVSSIVVPASSEFLHFECTIRVPPPLPLIVDPPFWANHTGDVVPLLKAANWTISLRGALFYDSLYRSDLIQHYHVQEGSFWEQGELERTMQCVPEGGVVFDVGANIGNNAVFWATQGHPARVYAFEPIPDTFSILTTNIEINGLQSIVTAINAAVGDVPERLAVDSYLRGNIGGTRLKRDPEGAIPAITLDEFDFKEQRCDLLKIDVEGFECQVVKGAMKFLARFHPHIFIEVVEEGQKKWVAETLAGLGYRQVCTFGADNYLYSFEDR
jgi:FkbM family methyltransferase